MRRVGLFIALIVALATIGAPGEESFRFAILGDRTGATRPGVYEQVWQETAAEDPALVVTAGDTIQGLDDTTAEAEWQQVRSILAPYQRYRLYLAPGNHDIWSERSQKLFLKYAAHPPHYGFDYEGAHFTVLDNSRSERFSPDELAFLESDLKAHAAQQVKFIVSHRPSWLLDAVVGNTRFPDRKSTRLNSSHLKLSRMPSSA